MDPLALLLFTTTLIAVSVTDVRERRIPNRLLMAAAAAALVFSVREGAATLGTDLLAAFVISLPLFIAALIRPEGMGMGDAKLVAVIGLFLGWQAVPALLVGLLLAGITGVLISLGRRLPPSQTSLPLAPFLAAGALPVAVYGLQALQ